MKRWKWLRPNFHTDRVSWLVRPLNSVKITSTSTMGTAGGTLARKHHCSFSVSRRRFDVLKFWTKQPPPLGLTTFLIKLTNSGRGWPCNSPARFFLLYRLTRPRFDYFTEHV